MHNALIKVSDDSMRAEDLDNPQDGELEKEKKEKKNIGKLNQEIIDYLLSSDDGALTNARAENDEEEFAQVLLDRHEKHFALVNRLAAMFIEKKAQFASHCLPPKDREPIDLSKMSIDDLFKDRNADETIDLSRILFRVKDHIEVMEVQSKLRRLQRFFNRIEKGVFEHSLIYMYTYRYIIYHLTLAQIQKLQELFPLSNKECATVICELLSKKTYDQLVYEDKVEDKNENKGVDALDHFYQCIELFASSDPEILKAGESMSLFHALESRHAPTAEFMLRLHKMLYGQVDQHRIMQHLGHELQPHPNPYMFQLMMHYSNAERVQQSRHPFLFKSEGGFRRMVDRITSEDGIDLTEKSRAIFLRFFALYFLYFDVDPSYIEEMIEKYSKQIISAPEGYEYILNTPLGILCPLRDLSKAVWPGICDSAEAKQALAWAFACYTEEEEKITFAGYVDGKLVANLDYVTSDKFFTSRDPAVLIRMYLYLSAFIKDPMVTENKILLDLIKPFYDRLSSYIADFNMTIKRALKRALTTPAREQLPRDVFLLVLNYLPRNVFFENHVKNLTNHAPRPQLKLRPQGQEPLQNNNNALQ